LQELFDEKREAFVEWLKYQWDINFDCIRRDIDIQGSPERTIARIIFQEKDGTLLLLEQFPESKFKVRHTVARAIFDFFSLFFCNQIILTFLCSYLFFPFGSLLFQLNKSSTCCALVELDAYCNSVKIFYIFLDKKNLLNL